jgi:hypothetical protein
VIYYTRIVSEMTEFVISNLRAYMSGKEIEFELKNYADNTAAFIRISRDYYSTASNKRVPLYSPRTLLERDAAAHSLHLASPYALN